MDNEQKRVGRMTTVAFSNRELHKMADFVAETNLSWRIFPFEINLK